MYRVNAQRSGVHPGPAPAERPEEIWTFQAGNETHFNAVVANETLFVGSLDGNLYALDARTGTERWHFAGGGQITGSAAVADGIVYTPDGAGALVALDVASGAELWRANADMAVTGSSSPIVVDGVVYIPSADGHAYGFDALTGAERWSWAGTQPARGIAISDGVAYVGAEDRRLHAISLSDGRELWYVPTRSSGVSSSIVDGGTVYVSNLIQPTVDTSELLAIDAPSGEVRWQFQAPTGLQVLPGAVANGALYVATADSGVYALAADNGTELWHADVPASLTAMAVVGDELFVTSTESEMIALRASDGGELWRIPIADGTDYGAAVTGGFIFQADAAGTVHAFGAPSVSPGSSASPTSSPSPSPLPEAFELVDTFDADTSGLSVPSGLDVGPDGNLYVANAGTDEILVLDPNGAIVRRWGEHGTAAGQFNFQRHGGNDKSGALSIDADGFVYVADFVNDRIQKFNPEGEFVLQWGSFGQGDGQFAGPYDIAAGGDGSVWVVDEERLDIQKFTGDGRFLLSVGEQGSEPGQLKFPGGITVDRTGTVYVADYNNNRVQAWDNQGTFLWALGQRGTDPGEFIDPNDVAVDDAGRVYVVEEHTRLQIFDHDQRPIGSWTGPFLSPDGIVFVALDHEDHAYLSDYFGNHIYKLRALPLTP